MKAIKLISGLVGLLVVLPIWYYLVYKILEAINASELLWFLYWIYFPAGVFVAILTKIAESSK